MLTNAPMTRPTPMRAANTKPAMLTQIAKRRL
jgi:hypothetical protein